MSSDDLFAAILAAPEDDAPRLVWADREGGERGELVVVQCQLARRDLLREDRRRLVARERELLARFAKDWGIGPDVAPEFRRGFIEAVRTPLSALRDVLERAPLVNDVHIADLGGPRDLNRFQGPTAHEAWAEIAATLRDVFAAIPADRIRALAARPVLIVAGDWNEIGDDYNFADPFIDIVTAALRELRELSIYSPQIGAIDPLRALPLERLWIPGTTAEQCIAVLRALPSLRHLTVSGYSVPLERELPQLFAAPELGQLASLGLELRVGDADFQRLATTPALASLRSLSVRTDRVSAAAVRALARSPHLANLETLGLSGMLEDEGIRELAAARFAPSLRKLTLRYPLHLTPAAAEPLLAFPALETLEIVQADRLAAALPHLRAVIPEVRGA